MPKYSTTNHPKRSPTTDKQTTTQHFHDFQLSHVQPQYRSHMCQNIQQQTIPNDHQPPTNKQRLNSFTTMLLGTYHYLFWSTFQGLDPFRCLELSCIFASSPGLRQAVFSGCTRKHGVTNNAPIVPSPSNPPTCRGSHYFFFFSFGGCWLKKWYSCSAPGLPNSGESCSTVIILSS